MGSGFRRSLTMGLWGRPCCQTVDHHARTIGRYPERDSESVRTFLTGGWYRANSGSCRGFSGVFKVCLGIHADGGGRSTHGVGEAVDVAGRQNPTFLLDTVSVRRSQQVSTPPGSSPANVTGESSPDRPIGITRNAPTSSGPVGIVEGREQGRVRAAPGEQMGSPSRPGVNRGLLRLLS